MRALTRAAGKTGHAFESFHHRCRISRLGIALPADNAPRLIPPGAGGQADGGQIRLHGDRPANGINRHDAGSDRRPRNLIAQQLEQVARPLAVPCKDQRTRGIGFEKRRKGQAHIAIGRRQRLLASRLVGEECAIIGLSIARHPDIADRVEGARLPLHETPRSRQRILVVQSHVPMRAAKSGDVGSRMDEEDSRLPGNRFILLSGGFPQSRIALRDVWPGEPHPGIIIGIDRKRGDRGKGFSRHHDRADQLHPPDAVNQQCRKNQHDKAGDDIEELAGQNFALRRSPGPPWPASNGACLAQAPLMRKCGLEADVSGW